MTEPASTQGPAQRALDAKPGPAGGKKAYILALCCVGQFLAVVDVSVTHAATPLIRADLGFSNSSVQWVVNAYLLLFAGFLLLGGRAADLLSQRVVFIGGFFLFSGGSLAGGLATHPLTLVIARGVQGLGAAVLAPATLSIVTSTFTDSRERARALGIWGAVSGSAGSMGLLVGGSLTDLIDWRWVLLVNAPVGVVSMLAARRLIPPVRGLERAGRTLDVGGAATLSAGLIALVYATVTTDDHGWVATQTLVPAAVGVTLLVAFVVIEARFARYPLVPLHAFRRRKLASANLIVFLYGFSILAAWYFAALYLQQNLGFNPVQVGVAFIPMAVGIIVCSRVAGALTIRYGTGHVLAVGMFLIGVALVLYALMPVNGSYVGDFLAPTIVTAIGVALAFVSSIDAATADAAPNEAGLAAGLVNTSRQIGGAFGLAVMVTIAATREGQLVGRVSSAQASTSGFRYAFVVSAIIAGLAAVLSATLLHDRRSGRAQVAPDEARVG